MTGSKRVLGVALGSLCLTLLAASCGGSSSRDRGTGRDDSGSGGVGADSAGGGGDTGLSGGGERPSAGAAGEGGSAPLTPNGGAGNAGAGGESGAGGATLTAAYEATDCRDERLELNDELVHFCVLVSSCTGALGDIQSCVSAGAKQAIYLRSYNPAHPLSQAKRPIPWGFLSESCPLDIDSCDDVLACGGFRVPAGECDSNTQARCEGQLAINCGANAGVTNCERQTGKPSSCEVVGTGDSARARCIVEPSCAVEGQTTCQGDMLVNCSAGKGDGVDCHGFGQICEETDSGAYCAAPIPAETCDEPGTLYCDGDSPAFCSSEGKLFKSAPCSSTGDLECGGAAGQFDELMGCFAPSPPCYPGLEDTNYECVGDDLQYGSDLYQLRVHCPAYGFATCHEGRCTN